MIKNEISELREVMGLERKKIIRSFLASHTEEQQLSLVKEVAEGWNWDSDLIEALAYSPHLSVQRDILLADCEGWGLLALIIIAANSEHEALARMAWDRAVASIARNEDGSELEKLDSVIGGLVFLNFKDRLD